MAEKGFGVKEVNLIGASGTPTITSPNNLNLNAVNVAISTNASIGGNLTVSGTVGIAGTLTYEDVTNIDSVGIVTAREGVFLPDNKELKIGNTAGSPDLKIYHNSSNNHSIIQESGTGSLRLQGNEIQLLNPTGTVFLAQFIPGSFVKLFHDGSNKFETNSSGVTITGTLAATAVTGDGSGLTGIAVTEAPVTDYTITANGSSAYRFHGGGVDETADDPDLYLVRGQKYRFNNTTGSSHPFRFRVSSGGSTYTSGVSGSENGVQFFTVPLDAPSSIVYQCTIHSGMVGNIYIGGGSGANGGIPVFMAYRTTNYNSTTSPTVLVFNEEKIDVGGNYDTSNGRFTAPVTGLYEFAYASIAKSTPTVYRYDIRINGSIPYSGLRQELRIDQSNNSAQYGTNGEFCCYLNMTAGQYAQVYLHSDAAVNNVYGNSGYGYTYFRGRLIG